MILNKSEIKERIEKNGMVSEYINLVTQIQSNGFDISVKDISIYRSPGTIDFDNSKRELPEYIRLKDCTDEYHLQFGGYLINYNEHLRIPDDIIAIGYPRSSLLRMGANIPSAIFDAGFNGYSQGMLIVNNSYGLNITKNARVLQLIFLDREDDNSSYNGKYAAPLAIDGDFYHNKVNEEDCQIYECIKMV